VEIFMPDTGYAILNRVFCNIGTERGGETVAEAASPTDYRPAYYRRYRLFTERFLLVFPAIRVLPWGRRNCLDRTPQHQEHYGSHCGTFYVSGEHLPAIEHVADRKRPAPVKTNTLWPDIRDSARVSHRGAPTLMSALVPGQRRALPDS
jgi:hypothetical protein